MPNEHKVELAAWLLKNVVTNAPEREDYDRLAAKLLRAIEAGQWCSVTHSHGFYWGRFFAVLREET